MSADTTTLNRLYDGDWPAENEMIWEFVTPHEMDKAFPLVDVDPVRLAAVKPYDNGLTLLDNFKENASRDQKKYVSRLRKLLQFGRRFGPIVIYGNVVVDGQHRTVAMALERVRSATAVQLEED